MKRGIAAAVGRQRDGYWKDPRQSRAGYYYYYYFFFFLPFREIRKSPHPWLFLLLLDGDGCCLFWFLNNIFQLMSYMLRVLSVRFLIQRNFWNEKKKWAACHWRPLSLRIVSWHIHSLVTAGKWENAVPIWYEQHFSPLCDKNKFLVFLSPKRRFYIVCREKFDNRIMLKPIKIVSIPIINFDLHKRLKKLRACGMCTNTSVA